MFSLIGRYLQQKFRARVAFTVLLGTTVFLELVGMALMVSGGIAAIARNNVGRSGDGVDPALIAATIGTLMFGGGLLLQMFIGKLRPQQTESDDCDV